MTPKPSTPEGQESFLTPPPAWGTYKKVSLDELPPDDRLLGFSPSPAFVADVRAAGIRVAIILEVLPDEEVYTVPCTAEGEAEEEAVEADYEIVREVRYRVRAGRRRIKAARAVGMTHIKSEVFQPGTTDESITLAENLHRAENPVAEFEAVRDLAKRHGKSAKEIGASLGIKHQTVERLMSLTALVPELLAGFSAGRIRPSAAMEAAKLPKSVQEGLVGVYQETGRLTVKQVRESKQVRVRDQLQDLGAGVFDTPGADEEGPEPDWPVTDSNGTVFEDRGELEEHFRSYYPCRDADDQFWIIVPHVTHVLFQRDPEADGEGGASNE